MMRYNKREKKEFDQKIIDIRRVARVVAGGRRFSFSVSLVAGDRKGRVGVGIAKSTDTSLAIEKAYKSAKKNIVTLKLTKEHSIPHELDMKFNSARIFLRPAPEGKGLTAGSSARTVLELGGVKDVNVKVISRSKNKINIARATVNALKSLE